MASSGWQTWNNLYTSSFGYDYFKCSIRIDSITHSGNTVTVSGAYGVKNDGGYSSYYVYPINAAITGSGYSQVTSRNQWIGTNEIAAVGFTTSFTASAGSTSANVTVEWSYNNGTAYNAYTYTLYFDASYTAPTGLSVSNIVRGQDSFTATVSVSGWGGTGSSSTRYRELQVWTQGMVEPRRYEAVFGDSTSGTITCGNSSSGSLTIIPNTMYRIGCYASNGSLNTGSQSVGDYTTLPPTTSLSNVEVTQTTARFIYSVPNQGGTYDMVLKKQLDGGTAETVTTLTGSGTKSGEITITGLAADTTHTLVVSLSTSAGEVVSNTVTFSTTPVPPACKLYCPALQNNQYVLKQVKKLYGPTNKHISSINPSVTQGPATCSVSDTSLLLSKLQADTTLTSAVAAGGSVRWIQITAAPLSGSQRVGVYLYYYDGTGTSKSKTLKAATTVASVQTFLSNWGISYNVGSSVSGHTYVYPYASYVYDRKEIKKLYGSVNDVTKLIYVGS